MKYTVPSLCMFSSLLFCSLNLLSTHENLVLYPSKSRQELLAMSSNELRTYTHKTNKEVHKKITQWEEDNHYTLIGGILASGTAGTAASATLLMGVGSLLNIPMDLNAALTIGGLPGCVCAVLFAVLCRPTFPEEQQLLEAQRILQTKEPQEKIKSLITQ